MPRANPFPGALLALTVLLAGLPGAAWGNDPGSDADGAGPALWLELPGYDALPAAAFAPSNDVLERLRHNFALPEVMNPQVAAQLDWFVRHPDYLARVFTRAQRYLPYIVDELETRQLPLELALLPIVESAYDPFAYSHGRASGLWQMIPGTASRFGIRQNWWYDGRRDVVDSTNGALDYLAYLHELMDGDWLLAIASYNSGEGNVLRAKKRNAARARPTDFWHLDLPRETSSYVPKLLALAEIVRRPEAHGLELPALVMEPQFALADTGGQLDLALAAELAGLDLDTLYAYNSGFNRWATDPEGAHRLLLPLDAAERFGAALTALPDEERLRWQRHRIGKGETLSEIADRYHTTLQSIRDANELRGNTIRAGDYLMIPVAAKPLAAYSQSVGERRAAKQNKARAGNRIEHFVQPGESFWSLSRKYGVGMRELAGWNGMAPRDTLSIGQKLVVWTDKAVPHAVAARGSNPTTRKLNYTVRRGDSLYRIANRFRITVTDLVRWNNLNQENILRPGQTLTMYVDVTRQSS
ncbi:MAG TPA: LysM peptidoglycan-binding domain-containing protein [Woeseiaceae bacterium]|nr:LysM peptidoglycan-binding domain-containing protein [Woeseiaceae bacterium]